MVSPEPYPPASDITEILDALGKGDSAAGESLMKLVYTQLHNLAAGKMCREKPGHTLQATALVHEAWLRIGGGVGRHWKSRYHFFAAAAEAMRRILIETARRKNAMRHGGGLERINVEEIEIASPDEADELLGVAAALERFERIDPEKAEVVKLRYFVGLTNQEVAEILDVSDRTVKRHWEYARAWLYDALHAE
jgi:RNA polymerase sigma factor (TIGR02999 family)